MPEQINARGLAISMYGSVTGFARELNWSRSKASRLLAEPDAASLGDIKAMVTALHIKDPNTIAQIFFN